MSEDDVTYRVAEGIGEIVLDRPPVNALSLALIEAVIARLREAADDPDVRAVIVRSANPKVFCAGLDLDLVVGKNGLEFRRFLERLYMELYDVQHRLGKPSIAAVAGAARAGGMTLALSCDMVLAGESASFGYPEVKVGLIPALHLVHLPRQAGRYRAFAPLLNGEAFDAAEADRLGLLSGIVADAELLDAARAEARRFAAIHPDVLKHGKDVFMRANDTDWRRGFENMADALCTLVTSEASQALLGAFVDARKRD